MRDVIEAYAKGWASVTGSLPSAGFVVNECTSVCWTPLEACQFAIEKALRWVHEKNLERLGYVRKPNSRTKPAANGGGKLVLAEKGTAKPAEKPIHEKTLAEHTSDKRAAWEAANEKRNLSPEEKRKMLVGVDVNAAAEHRKAVDSAKKRGLSVRDDVTASVKAAPPRQKSEKIVETPVVRSEFEDAISSARATDAKFKGDGRYEAEAWMRLKKKHPGEPLPSLSVAAAEYVRDEFEADGKPVPAEASIVLGDTSKPAEADPATDARKWKNNGDGTYTSPNGTVWKKAAKGGETSPVTGAFFAGGALMPIHGKGVKSTSDGDGPGEGGADVGSGGRRKTSSNNTTAAKPHRVPDKNGNMVEVPPDHRTLQSIAGQHPSLARDSSDETIAYLGSSRNVMNAISDAWDRGVVSVPRDAAKDNATLLSALSGPKDGDRNADGLVFRNGRWHRDEVEKPPGVAGTPRSLAAEASKKLDETYEFARASSIGNMGQDLKGSARHKRNEWTTLADAERNGTAESMVKRDTLLKNEPHELLANISPENALQTLTAHLCLSTFPKEPGEYPASYSRYKFRSGEPLPPPKSPEVLRQQYLDAYHAIKSECEIAATEETSPKAVLTRVQAKAKSLIRQFRETSDAYPSGKDYYNPVANGLVDVANRCSPLTYGLKKTDVYARVMDFASRSKEKYPDITRDSLSAIVAHVSDVVEGDSFNKTFGTVQAGIAKRFNPSEAYVMHAERSGGRVIDAGSVEKLGQFMSEDVGLRGVQWGNYVTDKERWHHLAKSAESLADLADALGIPDKAVSLSGNLGLAIGARGMGNALAHYEPDTRVINLTRASGAGSLAHEWGHAMDHFLGGDTLLSESTTKTPGAISEKMRNVIEAFHSSGFMDRLRSVDQYRLMPDERKRYWSSKTEVFARTFERYVQEKLHDAGRENTYLVGLRKDGHPLWPTKDEIEKMRPAIEELLSEVKKAHFS